MAQRKGKAGKGDDATIPADAYSLESDELHPLIEKAAFASGGYPYPKRMKRKRYAKELEALQIELLKLQDWAQKTGERLVMVFEGRDAAGKGGTIKRVTQHLNPRNVNVVALPKPTEAERGQWYFQRYVAHLPTAGDISLFDRSWYNRAGVEQVMGFCTPEEVEKFYREAPEFEHMLVRDGIRLFKFWFTVGREEQLRRFHQRKTDPLKHWKLSPIDYAAVQKWDDYTAARREMFAHTHTEHAPWIVVKANDKLRLRLNTIRVVLSAIDYPDKDQDAIGTPDDKVVGSGEASFD